MEAITVIIAENELAEREKLKSLLANETDIQVIGEARDGRECVDLARRQRPTIALIKQDLPVINGLAAAEQISAEMPEVDTIVSARDSPQPGEVDDKPERALTRRAARKTRCMAAPVIRPAIPRSTAAA